MITLEEYYQQRRELLAAHAHHSQPPPGLYLKLLHGRMTPYEQLDTWGPDGPWIGPLRWVHVTYMSGVNLCFTDGKELVATSMEHEGFGVFDDLLFYDGVYYGDWEIYTL